MNKQDFKEGFILTFENAQDHFDVAGLLSEKKMYGLAVSHLILSAEESIKAMYFSMQFLNIGVDNDEVKKLFSLHKEKHRKIQIGSKVIKEIIMDFLDEVSVGGGKIKEDFEEIKETIEKSDYKIWDQANSTRNSGFYVDYSENGFSTPRQMSDEKYKIFYQLAWQLIIANGVFSLKSKNIS